MFTSVKLSQNMIQKKLNKVLESQKTKVLRSQGEYAVKDHTCSETITQQIDVADTVEDAEKCRRQWRSHFQKLHCDSVRYQYNTQ